MQELSVFFLLEMTHCLPFAWTEHGQWGSRRCGQSASDVLHAQHVSSGVLACSTLECLGQRTAGSMYSGMCKQTPAGQEKKTIACVGKEIQSVGVGIQVTVSSFDG